MLDLPRAFDPDNMQVGDHGSLPLDTQRSGKKVGVVQSNVVRVDIVEVGVCPHASQQQNTRPPCSFATHSSSINNTATTATATSLQYPHVQKWSTRRRCASTRHTAKRERGGSSLEGPSSIFRGVLVHLYWKEDSLSLH